MALRASEFFAAEAFFIWKKELRAWPLRTMWWEKFFLWIGKFLMVDWEPDGVLSCILLSIAELPIWKEISLIADLKKFYRVSNSIAKSPIRKEMFIIAERRQFFQVFYCWIAMLWTQKLWMQNTRLLEFFPLRFFIKELSKRNCWNLSQYIFLNYNCCCCCCCCSPEDSAVVKTSIF